MAFLFIAASCTKDVQHLILTKPSGCDSTVFSYGGDIQPIIAAHCSGSTCHSGGNSNYDYSTYAVLADRIRSGRLEERLILPADDPLHMPMESSLDACELYQLRAWIHQGFKNN